LAGTDRDAPLLSRRALLTFGAGAALTVVGAGVAFLRPAAETAPETEAALEPTGSFFFRPRGLKEIPVHYALGAGDPQTATLVVVMHGDSRNAIKYRDTWADLIVDRPVVAVVPEFTTSDFVGSRQYNQGGVLDQKGDLRPPPRWTFSYIEPLFHEMRSRVAGQQTTFDLFGHSAGAQFVHRYVELAPSRLVRRAVAANAGWYTMTDPAIDYPYGAGGAPRDLFDWSVAFGTRLTVMLGDDDVLDNNLRHDEGSDAQGLTRWERGHTFFDRARDHAATLDVPFAWDLHEVAGVGHENKKMSARALDLLV
jgi:hypothetical protein